MHTLLVRVLSRSRRFSFVALIVIALAAAASAQVFLGAQSTLPGTFTSPTGVATDTAGNIYVVATVPASNIVKIDAVTHAATTYISSGQLINGSALKQDVFISSDAANNLYIADSPNNRIVKWNMTTNSWVADYTTTGGSPVAAAADTSGNVWWVSGSIVLMFDTGSTTSSHQVASAPFLASLSAIAFNSTNDIFVVDVVGKTVWAFYASAGYATATSIATFPHAYGLYLDPSDNLYVAGLTQAWRIDAANSYATLMPLTVSGFTANLSVTADRQGNIFLTDESAGTVTELAASGNFGSVDVASATPPTLTLNYFMPSGAYQNYQILDLGVIGKEFIQKSPAPASDCVLSIGSYYAADTPCTITVVFNPTGPGPRYGAVQATDDDNQPRTVTFLSGVGVAPQVAFSPAVINSVAGNGTTTYTGDGSLATATGMNPGWIAFDAAGNLFLSDVGNYGVRMVDATTQLVSTIAGSGTKCNSSAADYPTCGDEDRAIHAELNSPGALALDGDGNIYFADTYINRIRKVDFNPPNHIHTVAGIPGAGAGYCCDGGPATSAQLANPYGVAVDAYGNLFIGDTNNNRVRRVDAQTGIITTYAGGATPCADPLTPCGDGGLATAAQLNMPMGIALDAAGNLFIAEQSNARVRRVDALTQIITTVAGNGYLCDAAHYPCGDGGLAVNARLNQPVAVRVDAGGSLYIADDADFRVRRVDFATQNISTIAGNQTQCATAAGVCGDTGAATSANLIWTLDLAFDPGQQLYLADRSRVRQLTGAATVQFPDTKEFSTSADRSVTMSNIGNAALKMHVSGLSTNFGFGAGGTCTFPMGGGTSCLWDFVFSPLTTGSPINGSYGMLINNLNVVGPQTIPLSGNGLPAQLATTITAANASAVYSASAQSVTLSATVTSTSVVNEGTVTFTLTHGGSGIGTATTSGTVTAGAASVSYSLPAGTAAGSYTITATYNPAAVNPQFLTSTDNTHTLTVQPLTPAFSNLSSPTITYGQPQTTLGGSISGVPAGGLVAITWSTVSTTATVTTAGTFSATVDTHLLPAGPYTIAYNFAGAPPNIHPQSGTAPATVNQAALSITAANDSKTYGQTKSYGAGSTAFTSSGLVNSETIGTVTITPSGGTAASAPVGGYTLTPSAATGGTFTASNYSIAYHAGTLTVGAASLSITASNDSKTYGQTKSYGAGSTAFTSSGLVNSETIGTVTITPSGGTAASAPVGGYTLTPSAATGGTFTLSNYGITYNSGTLTVGQAPLTVTANNQAMAYGATVPTFTASYSGFANGEILATSGVTGSPTLSTVATSTSPVGSYSITAAPGTLAAGNYSFTLVNGMLAVNKAGTTTQVQAGAALVLLKNSATFAAQVNSATTGIPTGTVTFLDGGTAIGSAALNASGAATLTLSTLTVGAHSITASYGGDANFTTSSSAPASASVQDFQILVNGAAVTDSTVPVLTQSITQGQSVSFVFQVSPTPGTTFPSGVTLSLAGLPAGFTYTISPTALAQGSGAQQVTVTIGTRLVSGLPPQTTHSPGGLALGLLLPALGVLRLRRARSKRARRVALLLLLLLVLGIVGLAGCGGSSGFYDYSGHTYTMQLNGTGGALQHFTTFSLTVR